MDKKEKDLSYISEDSIRYICKSLISIAIIVSAAQTGTWPLLFILLLVWW